MPRALTLALAAAAAAAALALAPTASPARDLLGVFSTWAAFRDPAVPRCYAIAQPLNAPKGTAWADIGDWPHKNLRGQVHIRLPRALAPNSPVTLTIAGQHLRLTTSGSDAWAADPRMDAAITAALRSAPGMTVTARSAEGRAFSVIWPADGAATAMDAALVGCAKI